MDTVTANAALAAVFREEAARLTALLVRILGDFDVAEDIVQDALVVALERWPREGIPDQPGAWLLTVARRRAIDKLRRDVRYHEKLAQLDQPERSASDDRLRLIFTCCHPALSREAQVALTLRTVCGFTPDEIAAAFLTSEATIAQRLVRARRKIRAAAIPYRIPDAGELNERLGEVLAVLYLMFNEGYLTSAGEQPERRDLAEEAEWLAALLLRLMPTEPEVMGLSALIRLHRARARSRFDAEGRLVLLRDQDRSQWDRPAIAAAADLVVTASRLRRPGPYQLQAAIIACHAESPSWERTDWLQIFLLYQTLLAHDPSPVVRLNRAIALRYVSGPEAALRDVDTLREALGRYHLYHATRAELLRELGRLTEARHADAAALQLTANPAERALLEQRL
ncbi:MAG TPA: sigma-70 family RNA polymerase sigma factor [Chloroflexota bacterium]|nr:sigma-70 family RNA polymerase sigma factor [Chloroflexota bacterium]